MFTYGRFSGDYNPQDYVHLERYEAALEHMQGKLGYHKSAKASETVKAVIEAASEFFDRVFEPGAGAQILDGSTDMAVALSAVEALVSYSQERQDAAVEHMKAIRAKYAPTGRGNPKK